MQDSQTSSLRKRTSTTSSGLSEKSVETNAMPFPTNDGAAHGGLASAAAAAKKEEVDAIGGGLTSSLSLPRALLRGLAMRAAQNPIEVVVSIFIVVTLSYFQLVHVLATSNFFEPLSREATGLAAASTHESTGRPMTTPSGGFSPSELSPISQASIYLRKSGQTQWISVSEESKVDEVQYVVEPFVLADVQREEASVLSTIAKKLSEELLLQASLSDANLVEPFPLREAESGFVGYGFGRISEWNAKHWSDRHDILRKADNGDFLGLAINESLISLNGQNLRRTRRGEGIADMELLAIFPDADLREYFVAGDSDQVRTMRWLGYALWALVMRFGALLKRADSADIFVMLSAYILMHGTFVNLFISMRRFGSNFWLGASVLTSSICAFLVALTMAHLLGVTVDPICLSEALPFLVITVGFEKPFLLTKAVFTHAAIAPQASTPSKAHPSLLLSALNDSQQAVERQRQQQERSQRGSVDATESLFNGPTRSKEAHLSQEESFVRALTARLKSEPSLRWTSPQPVPAREVVVAAVDEVGVQIVRDYAIEIAVMAVGATSGISGLREFCQLAALILAFDCAFLFAFYAGILTIMVEVHRIKVMRGRKRVTPSTPPNVDSDVPTSHVSSPNRFDDGLSPTSAGTRETSPDFGSKKSGNRHGQRPLWRKIVKLLLGKVPFEPTRPGARENPVARLKLLLVTTFITLHSLNLVSTLTTQSAMTRHHSTDGVTIYQQVQEASKTLQVDDDRSSLLQPLLSQLAMSVPAANADLYVKVYDPVLFILSHPLQTNSGNIDPSSRSAVGSAALNAFNNGQGNSDTTSSLAAHMSATHSGITRSTNLRSSSGSSLNVLDSFMSGWTIIVGDPVISKWISVALVISIFLNAYLLKGIATGNAAVAEGNAAGAAAFAAARMIGAHLNRPAEEAPKPVRAQTVDQLSEYHRSLAKAASAFANKKSMAGMDISNVNAEKSAAPLAVGGGAAAASASDAVKSPRSSDKMDKDSWTSKRAAYVQLNGISSDETATPRSFDEIVEVYADGAGVVLLSDEEVILLVQKGKIAGYSLEKILQDHERAVRVRRATISRASVTQSLEHSLVPLSGYDYSQVMGACCENVVGFMPLPLGIAGPLLVDGQMLPIPMATTEGTLVASTSRGCKALNAAGGVTTVLTQDAITRGPAVEFTTITQAAKAKRWIDSPDGASTIKEAFDSTSRFARLSSLRCVMAGRTLYIRFATSTGDAMGMNMVSKGVEKALACMGERFDMTILSLSGNYCIDKKPSAINWIEGRGKSVCCEAVIPGKIVKSVLKTSVESLVNLNLKKNLIGSAMAGSIGGFNAHAANIVAAVFLATGQDPAQVVESAMCMTLMEAIPSSSGAEEPDMLVTVSMPSIEVGTVGGGTILSPQRGLLEMLGVAGSSKDVPGANAQRLARIIAAAVMAGELSLMGALSAGHLIQAHMKHNRSVPPTPGNVTPTSTASLSFTSGLSSLAAPSGCGGFSSLSGGGPSSSSSSSAATTNATTNTARFQSSMTPLIAPPVGSGPQSRGSPVGTLSAKDRRSASAM